MLMSISQNRYNLKYYDAIIYVKRVLQILNSIIENILEYLKKPI